MGKLKMCFLIAVVLFAPSSILSAALKARAAFDIGSGAVKMEACIVDTEKQTIVGKPLATQIIYNYIYDDVVAHQGFISPEKETETLTILKKFKGEALKSAFRAGYSEVEFFGIATAIFRNASNGLEVLKRWENDLDVSLEILSQIEEGRLGFLTAKALFPDIEGSNILAWDTGRASSQIAECVDGQFHILECPFGFGTVRNILATEIRNGLPMRSDQYGLPIKADEARILHYKIIGLIPELPRWLTQKIISKNLTVTQIGDEHFSLGGMALIALNAYEGRPSEIIDKGTLTRCDIEKIHSWLCNKDEKFCEEQKIRKNSFMAVIIMKAMMDHLDIKEVQFAKTNGSTLGLLIAPEYWD